MQLIIDNKKQKEFANEITKKFSFEELALLMYENSCEYCQKQHDCMGKVTPQDCAKNIRQKFEKSYKAESEDKE